MRVGPGSGLVAMVLRAGKPVHVEHSGIDDEKGEPKPRLPLVGQDGMYQQLQLPPQPPLLLRGMAEVTWKPK